MLSTNPEVSGGVLPTADALPEPGGFLSSVGCKNDEPPRGPSKRQREDANLQNQHVCSLNPQNGHKTVPLQLRTRIFRGIGPCTQFGISRGEMLGLQSRSD